MRSNSPLKRSSNPDGIFNCKQCGDCCKGYGGTYITEKKLPEIADYIGMKGDRFIREKCQITAGRLVLAQKSDGYCAFWDGLCSIYPVRPDMCRRWPFIDGVLRDIKNWHIMAGSCPGMQTDIPEYAIRECVEDAIRKYESSN